VLIKSYCEVAEGKTQRADDDGGAKIVLSKNSQRLKENERERDKKMPLRRKEFCRAEKIP
jgi:hypothetical protein